jgi:ElaB/YqjD/DUF883 family membrane-anchored ribosome-binding protein
MSVQDSAGPAVKDAIEKGRQAAEDASEAVKKLVGRGLNMDIREFVRDEPWLAVAAAFAVGYVAAKVMRRPKTD